MDGLVLIACTVLFLLLVVIPVMSILAYRRSNAARDELMLSYLRFQFRNRSQRLNPNRFLSNRLR